MLEKELYITVMTTPTAIRAILGSAFTFCVLAAFPLTGRSLSTQTAERFSSLPPSSVSVQQSVRDRGIPSWAECVTPLTEALVAPVTEFRSSLAFRGLATAAAMRPRVVIAEYTFKHNQKGPELENLTLALSSLDRLMMPAGSVLSFNDVTGPRVTERGYQEGLMYSAGKVVLGTGGGVCVASTALYNAALLAGLPITQRWMHSGPTSYAEPTRDAAVVFGLKDLRIKNNTGSPIWIKTSVTSSEVSVKLLSFAKLPYRVVLKEKGLSFIPGGVTTTDVDWLEPELVSKGAPGCNRILTREIWKDGKLLRTEEICHDIRAPIARVVGIRKPAPQNLSSDFDKGLLGAEAPDSAKISPKDYGAEHALDIPSFDPPGQ